jgi:predicted nucleic acid-binding protein
VADFFIDSSALVKRYVQELGTRWVRNLTRRNAAGDIYVARITAVEVTSAVARRRGGGNVTPARASSILFRFRKHLAGRYTIIEITPALIDAAMVLANRHELRAYDAVQLAAAFYLSQRNQDAGFGPLALVSSDRALNAAATANGTTVENPTLYP